jgi:LPXTG-motif cell wall-anchored protein/uncharacterized repeat protein (TIGR01451 family)
MRIIKKMKLGSSIIYLLILALLVQVVLPISNGDAYTMHTYAMEDKEEIASVDKMDEGKEVSQIDSMDAVSGSAITIQSVQVVTGSALYINKIEIKDVNGNDFVGEVKTNSKIDLRYLYSIPDGEEVDTNVVHTLTLPEEIKIIEDKVFDLMHGTRAIAKVKLYTNNTITYQFYDAVNDAEFMYERLGYIQVYSEFDEVKIGNEGPKDIIFDIPGSSSITVHVNFEKKEEKVDVSIGKSGDYDKNTNEITWRINVKPNSEPNGIPISNSVVKDVIPNDQTFIVGSTTFQGVNTSDNFTYDSGTKTLKYTFSGNINTTNNENYIITFKTKANTDAFIKEGNWVSFKNKATISYLDNFAKVISNDSNESSVGTTVDFIDKTGNYVANGQLIHWTVTINNNNLDIKNAQIIDTIPKGLELDTSTIMLVNKSDNTELTGGGYTNVGQVLTYNFNQDIKESYKLTYTTKVIDPDAYNSNNKEFTNIAEFKGDGVPNDTKVGIGVGIETNVISKAGKGYNTTNHEITWEITVNKNKIDINNAVISDDIPEGLVYVDGSFEIKKNGTIIAPDDLIYTPFIGDANKTGNLTYNFGNISDTYVATFRTKVLHNTAYAVNGSKDYKNSVTLTGKNANTNKDIDVTTDGTQKVTSEVIKKTALSYDHITREATWKIVVNQNKMPMKDTYVEDTIGKYEKLVDGSVKINGDAAKLGSNASEKDTYYYDSTTKKLTYNFPANITDQQIITFKTVIVDLSIFESNSSKVLTNTAILKGVDIPNNVSSTATKAIPNVVVEKKGTYTSGKDYIDWTVNMNQNKLTIANPILEDTLQAGLELDAATVKLIKLNTSANGDFTEGEDVTASLLKVSYDMNTRNVVFEFTGKIESAHRLTFRTDIDPAYNHATFNNTIHLKGGSFQNAGGGASGSGRGSITLIKVDSKTSFPLAGATFELLDMYMNPTKTSTVTGVDGKTLFNGLKYGNTYYIREKIAPTGYVLSDEVYGFTVKEEEGLKNITYSYKNEKMKGNITFTKLGEGGKLLAGAVFTLYKLEDVSYANPIYNTTSNSVGEVEFKDIDYGKYVIKETKAPEGYLLSEQVITAEIGASDNGKTVTANPSSVSNQIIRGNIIFTKLDEVGQPLQGAEFTLYESKDTSYTNPIHIITSKSDGIIEFKNIQYGSYIIKETKAPTGYVISEQLLSAVIGGNDNGKTVIANPSSISNQKIKGNITLIKVDESGKLLEGALFTIYHTNDVEYTNPISTSLSNSEGMVAFTNVQYGKYNIKETKAPEGYLLSNVIITAEIGDFDNGKTVTANPSSISNEIIKGNITFTKVDEAGKSLQGAVFTIYKSDDLNYTTPYGTATSNENGIVEFKNIEYGSYHIKETTAPSGYYISEQILTAVIGASDNGKTITSNPDSISNKKVIMPEQPTPTPGEPTPTPKEPTITPRVPTPTPKEPTSTPKVPTPTPGMPTPTPKMSTPTPMVPITETTPKDKPKEGYVEIPEDAVPKVGIPAKNGKVTVNKEGKWTYTPNPGFVGKDNFTITINYPDGTKDDIIIEIEVEDVPLGNGTLPKTGETTKWGYYISGIAITLLGVASLTYKKKNAKENR